MKNTQGTSRSMRIFAIVAVLIGFFFMVGGFCCGFNGNYMMGAVKEEERRGFFNEETRRQAGQAYLIGIGSLLGGFSCGLFGLLLTVAGFCAGLVFVLKRSPIPVTDGKGNGSDHEKSENRDERKGP